MILLGSRGIPERLRYLWGTGTQMGYQIDPLDVKNVCFLILKILKTEFRLKPEVLPVSTQDLIVHF